MMIPTHYREKARIIAQHEMGHHVISRCMGFGSGEVSLTLHRNDAHDGGATINLEEPFETVEQVRRYLERRVLVLFAGAIAETLPPRQGPVRGVDREKAEKTIQGQTADSDYGKARESIAMLRNILHPQTLDRREASEQKREIYNRLWGRAVDLVEQFEYPIVGVAGALTEQFEEDSISGSFTAILTEDVLAGIPALLEIPLLAP